MSNNYHQLTDGNFCIIKNEDILIYKTDGGQHNHRRVYEMTLSVHQFLELYKFVGSEFADLVAKDRTALEQATQPMTAKAVVSADTLPAASSSIRTELRTGDDIIVEKPSKQEIYSAQRSAHTDRIGVVPASKFAEPEDRIDAANENDTLNSADTLTAGGSIELAGFKPATYEGEGKEYAEKLGIADTVESAAGEDTLGNDSMAGIGSDTVEGQDTISTN